MKLIWLQILFAILAPKPTYLRGALRLLDHLDGDPCEDTLKDRWASLHLDHTKGSLDHVCKCHADRCVYIAVLHTSRQVPVYWAYQIHHEKTTALLDQGFLKKKIWTWYIPPKIIGDILRGRKSASQRSTVRSTSLPITHIVSGVVPADNKHIFYKSNWPKKDYIPWIAYNHTSTGGVTLDGAAIRDRHQWKQLSVVQLAAMLSGTYTNANLFRKLSGYRKVSKHGMEILPKKPAFTSSRKPTVVGVSQGQDERIFRRSSQSSLDVALENADRKIQESGQGFVEEEDTFQIEQDSLDESETISDIRVEVPGAVLKISHDAEIPEEPDQTDQAEGTQKDSKQGLEVSILGPGNAREQANYFLDILWERMHFQKTRPQQEVVPSPLRAVPEEIPTEGTTVTPETKFTGYNEDDYPTTTELPFTGSPRISPPTLADTVTPQVPDDTLPTVAPRREYTTNREEPWLASTTEILGTEYTVGINISGTPGLFPIDQTSSITRTTETPKRPLTSESFVTDHSEEPKISTIHEPQTTEELAPATESPETECTTEHESPSPESNRTTQQWETTYTVVERQETTNGGQPTECLETGFSEMATPTLRNQPSTTARQASSEPETPTMATECTEVTTTSSTTNEKEDHSEITLEPKTESHSETTEAPMTTKTAEALECTENLVTTLPFTPEPDSSTLAEIIKTTSRPEATSTESLDTECTSPTVPARSENPTDSTVSHAPEKTTTHVLETTFPEKTPVTSPPLLGDQEVITTYLPDFTTKGPATESTIETGSEDLLCTCYGLIHRTPAALQRCLEKMIALLKILKNKGSDLSPTTSGDQPSTHLTFVSQDVSRKSGYHSKLKDEENEHFYYFDGKLREKNNHSGPEANKT